MEIINCIGNAAEKSAGLWEGIIPAEIACETVCDSYAAYVDGNARISLAHNGGHPEETAMRKRNRRKKFHMDRGDDPENPVLVSRNSPEDSVAAANGLLIAGDNLSVGKTLLAATCSGTLPPARMIYMDPPFFSRAQYKTRTVLTLAEGKVVNVPVDAFSDRWHGGTKNGKALENYLVQIGACIRAAYALLAADGCLWLHLDHHAVHYVKILADHIFGGPSHLINEVVWQYKSGGASGKSFARKHDTLLFYAKDPRHYFFHPLQEKSYNRGYKPYAFKGVKEFEDEGGWYTLVNMKDVWSIDTVGRTSRERTGYATQKPLELLRRIISACTKPGDLCVDFFGGSGTMAVAAAELSREWISCDNNPSAIFHAERRLAGMGTCFDILHQAGTVAFPETVSDEVPRFQAKLECFGTSDPDRQHSMLKIVRFDPPMDFLQKMGRKEALFREAYRVDPMQFIAGFSVDPDYDGALFRPEFVMYGGNEMAVPAAVHTDKGERRIAVRVVDLFGNSAVRELNALEKA
jgi:DNA modification methylase